MWTAQARATGIPPWLTAAFRTHTEPFYALSDLQTPITKR
jgi:hypothetical protein